MSSTTSVPVSMSRYASRQSGATRARFCRSFTSAQRADNPRHESHEPAKRVVIDGRLGGRRVMRPARTVDDEVETVDAQSGRGLVQRAGKRLNARAATRFACGFTRGPGRSYTSSAIRGPRRGFQSLQQLSAGQRPCQQDFRRATPGGAMSADAAPSPSGSGPHPARVRADAREPFFDHLFALSGYPDIVAASPGNSNAYGDAVYPFGGGAPDRMPTDPCHEFTDVLEQLCGAGVPFVKGSRIRRSSTPGSCRTTRPRIPKARRRSRPTRARSCRVSISRRGRRRCTRSRTRSCCATRGMRRCRGRPTESLFLHGASSAGSTIRRPRKKWPDGTRSTAFRIRRVDLRRARR